MEGNNNEDDKKDAKPSCSARLTSCCTRFSTSMRNAGHFLYNSDTKEVLGRGGLSWLKILSFYLGFYCVLAGFWAACMVGFIRTLDPVAPTMQKMFSMMKDNPGMNFQPFIDTTTTLISFKSSNYSTYNASITKLNSVYSEYVNSNLSKICNGSEGFGANYDEACRFEIGLLGNSCTPWNDFGYGVRKPCVLLRINRVFLWQPNGATFDDANKCPPEGTTPDCQKQREFMALRPEVRSSMEPGFISVSCDGENDGDRDNIKKVTFYPSGGFPAYFYPYYNQQDPKFMSPPVMAQFDVIPGRVSLILCKIWTKDVIHDQNDLQGSIHFELFTEQ